MCDTLAVVDADGLLFAKNSDRPPDEPQVLRWFPARPAGTELRTQYLTIRDRPASAFLGSQPTWLWGVEHGVNEHGVVVGNEKLYTTPGAMGRPPALIGMDLVRLALERGHDAESAVVVITELVERHGQGGSGERDADEPYDSSFLVADATGGWVVETCDRTWAARPVGPGAAISNRIGLSTDWTRSSPDLDPGSDFGRFRHPKAPTGIADHRLATTLACVQARPSTRDAHPVLATLRSHRAGSAVPAPPPAEIGDDLSGITVCMHVSGVQATTASMVVTVPATDPRTWHAWAALGNPCCSVYLPVGPGGPPDALATEAWWRRFAALRDRIDADSAQLTTVRAALDPIESDCWNLTPPITDAQLRALDDALTGLGV